MTASNPPRLVRLDDLPRQPWRNGGGTTRELLTWPDAADWQVRVSAADVQQDGAFSAYPGVQRWIVVLKGSGLALDIDAVAHRLDRNAAPLCFDGAAATHCRLLDGPTLDLNLMLRGLPGRLLPALDGAPWQPTLEQCGLFATVPGRCRCADGADTALPAYALLWFDRAPTALTFEAAQRPSAATGWWLEAGT